MFNLKEINCIKIYIINILFLDIFLMEGASQPVDKEQFIRLAKDLFPK